MPFRIAPIACSRIPKCSMRPYRVASQSSVAIDGGPGRIWRPPSWCCCYRRGRPSRPTVPAAAGRAPASTSPEAARVATALGPAPECGTVVVPAVGQRAGHEPVQQRRALGLAAAPRRRSRLCHAVRGRHDRGRPACGCGRSRRRRRRSSCPGRNRAPPWSRRPPRRRAPSRAPCRCSSGCGAGQPMMVRSAMNDGRSVTARRCASAASSAGDVDSAAVRADGCTCQP